MRITHTKPRPVEEAAGTLIIIGGKEDREGDAKILRKVVDRTGFSASEWTKTPPSSSKTGIWR
jgi:cyanophycinase-like exopeptidase